MKQILRKNQVVISALAVMIALAGYLTYAGRSEAQLSNSQQILQQAAKDENEQAANAAGTAADTESEPQKDANTNLTDIPSLDNEANGEIPGEAILASGKTVNDFLAETRLNREQTRGKNKESLLEVVNNDLLKEEEKQKAIDSLVRLTSLSEMENEAETLLEAKGFENSIVSIEEDTVDVVICRTSLTNVEKAQIEDIVTRKTQMGIESIVITLLNTGTN